MPLKKRVYKKRRTIRRRPMIKRKKTGSILPRPRTFGFNRSLENVLDLFQPDGAWTATLDGQVVKTFAFALNQLPNYTDFVNLFNMYKLNYAVINFYPSYSVINRNGETTSALTQSNTIITVWQNSTGTPLNAAFTRAELNEISQKKMFMMPSNRPFKIKFPLSQLSNIYASTVNTDYAKVKPKYISTGEAGTMHYGVNVAITRCDNTSFGSDSMKLNIKEKVYLTTRQVQ